MLLGFKSRCTTPAEWTYFKPRWPSQRKSLGVNNATYQNLVKEVLNKLLLERSRSKQAMEISAEEFGDEVARCVSWGVEEQVRRAYISSRGEIKMSLRLMTCFCKRRQSWGI